MKNFKQFLTEEKRITDRALKEFLGRQVKEAHKLDGDFGKTLELIMAQGLRGGKRARPMLVRLAYELAGGREKKEAVKASLFTELIHEYLLVHDDIVDRDLLRYGGPTLEVEFADWFKERFSRRNGHFGKSMAMLAGDHLRTLAYLALDGTDFDEAVKNECKKLMEKVLVKTLVGWQIQYWLNFDKIDPKQEKRFLLGLKLVTSKYSFEAPLMFGLTLAGGNKQLEASLKKYAYHTGMAFQIVDDILGVFGDSEKTGKPVGNDLREGKKTLLILRAYENASVARKRILRRLVGKEKITTAQIKQVQQIIVDTGSLAYSQDLAQKHSLDAIASLTEVKTKNKSALVRLRQLAEFVVKRNY